MKNLREVFVCATAIGFTSYIALDFKAQSDCKTESTIYGFKTKNVEAKRMISDQIGYNISFTFPNNLLNSDTTPVWDFFETNGGVIFEGGGYPGATVIVKFFDVTNRESANKKLLSILPYAEQMAENFK